MIRLTGRLFPSASPEDTFQSIYIRPLSVTVCTSWDITPTQYLSLIHIYGEAGKSAYSVVFEHAGIRYPDAAQEAVSDITLNVRPGETIGIIGGTGSGKSSMVNPVSYTHLIKEV